jgi:hypothetical protein
MLKPSKNGLLLTKKLITKRRKMMTLMESLPVMNLPAKLQEVKSVLNTLMKNINSKESHRKSSNLKVRARLTSRSACLILIGSFRMMISRLFLAR